MGKVRRTLCISFPYTLSAASLICLVFANMTDFGSVIEKTLGELISRRSFTDNSLGLASDSISEATSKADQISDAAQDVTGSTVTETVGNVIGNAESLEQAISEKIANAVVDVPEFYTIGLWNYCEGSANGTGPAIINCTASTPTFWFNFTDILSLESSWTEELFPSQYKSVIKVYKSLSKANSAFFIMAVTANVLTIAFGLTATLSRWGSSFTSLFAVASVVFNLVRLILAIAAYFLLAGIFKLSLNGIGVTLGQPMLVAGCLATGFSILASFFWLLSSCCCSGK
ncbi:hypothetical protein BDV12DRAFT_190664 [Aspergillus spectabilis]